MNLLLQDLRYATRVLLKQPGFTFLVALTFALGIGANSAIFSVVNAVLLRPLPYAQPEQLVAVYEKRPALGRERNSVSPPDFLDWKAQNNVFQHIAAYTSASLNRTDADEPERLIATTASADFFATLGVPAQLGRTFAPEEDQAGAQRVAVLSHRLWQRRFGSDPKVIGRALTLNGNSYVVIGVMPRSFEYPDATTELWVPLVLDGPDAANRGMHFLSVIARLKKDTTLAGARAEMETIASRLEQAYDVNRGHGVNLFPLHSEVVGQLRKPLLVLAAAVGCVLLIACVNVANLLLVRATARRKEIAIRTALGATKPRIVRQFMAESLLLCVLGGTAGLLLAVWGTDLLVALSPANTPRREQIAIDPATLGFSLIASLSAALVFGLLPAWQFCRPAINDALKEGSRGSSDEGGRRLRSGLVVTEIALALVLLVGAGLLLKSFARLRDTDAGINPRGVLTAQVLLPRSKYKEPQAISVFARDALERMRTIPGVDLAGATVSLPLGEPPASRYFSIEGRAPTRPGEGANANFNLASPDYFRALSIPLRRGRDFNDRDVIGAPAVAIINEALARKYFPDEDALGKRIRIGDGEWHTIVGIVGDVRQVGLDTRPAPEFYFSLLQEPIGFISFAVRTTRAPETLANDLRNAVRAVDPAQPIFGVRTMEEVISGSVAPRRLTMALLASFAALAIILAAVGIYGVISYLVTQRTREIGIRMALGAQRRDVLRLILGHGLVLAAIGIAIGLAASFGFTRLLATLLFEVSARDPITYALAALLLGLVALVGGYIPGRRATKVDPVIALRAE